MFLEKLLPANGLVCVALAKQQGFAHRFFSDRGQAQQFMDNCDEVGHTVYLAQATFHTSENRKQTNAHSLKAFFVDIDCGEKHKYPTQREAALDLNRFTTEANLPAPAVVSSGGGLYAYWFLSHEIPASQWKSVAQVLKSTMVAYEFDADPTRTADSASVLRPPGSTNRKPGRAERTVKLVRDMEPVPLMTFASALIAAAKKKQVKPQHLTPVKPIADINADFLGTQESVPSSAHTIARKCSQVMQFSYSQGNVEEPLWYAMLGLLRFTEEGDDLCHEWSTGHPDYDADVTDRKIAQLQSSGTGPTTCLHFANTNPDGCLGCRHSGKIKSPIVLGRPEPVAFVPPADDEATLELEGVPQIKETEIEVPTSFVISKDGLYIREEGELRHFYDRPLYATRISYDESLGYEVITIKHLLPHDGWKEFTIRTSLVNDPKTLIGLLWDNHVHVVSALSKKAMCAYVESFAHKLSRNRAMSQLLCQMGWKEISGKPAFVLGKKIYTAGKIDNASLAQNLPAAANAYKSQGDLTSWVNTTANLNHSGMEAFAFTMLAGAFGAPLMKFTGYEGAMVSTVGESGVGKTLMARWIQSVYGQPAELMMLRDDTRNALVSRLGVIGSLPMTIDEVTNIDPAELSDLVYRVTQGRDKARLTKSAVERQNMNRWNTLAVVSSNSSLVDKLSGLKLDASAEINRVFEYPVYRHPLFTRDAATDVFRTTAENFGLVGEIYIKHLVDTHDCHRAAIDKITAAIDTATKATGEERFWSAIAGTAIYGGLLAKKLNLIQFEIKPVMEWVIRTIIAMRATKKDGVTDGVGILSQFLDEHASNRVIVRNAGGPRAIAELIEAPRGSLHVRMESDTQRIYISRARLKDWLARRFGSMTSLRNELTENGVLRDANKRKVLGAGTSFASGALTCWEIDLKNPNLGNVAVALVEDIRHAEKLQKAGMV